MRAILGLLPPRRGTIRVLGRPVARGNPPIGYMPQMRGALDSLRLSGWDFVASGVNGHRWGLPLLGRDARRRSPGRSTRVRCDATWRARPLAETSGGERQRLLLAQALLGRPRLLLLDEPLISLDPHHQRAVVELTRALQQELGIAVLFSAHELNPLLGALDRVLYLGHGHAALGTVDEVITGPVLSRLYGSEIEVVRVERTDLRHVGRARRGARRAPARPRRRIMFTYDFMQNAFAAAGIVALVVRAGRFLPRAARADLRRPCAVACRLCRRHRRGADRRRAALGPGGHDARRRASAWACWASGCSERDVAIGIVLSMSLGLGLLFLHFFTAYATQATALLFGNVLGVDAATVWTLLLLGIVAVGALGAIARPLLFASLQPELAEAKGVSLRLRVGAVPRHRRARRRGMRADRRRAAGLRADGRSGSGGAAPDHAALALASRCRSRWRWPRPGWGSRWPSHRLADQLLDHRAERRCLSAGDVQRKLARPYTLMLLIVLRESEMCG